MEILNISKGEQIEKSESFSKVEVLQHVVSR